MAQLDVAFGMESYLAPLVVLVLTGLTVYAYRYPDGYPAAAVILCCLLVLSGIGFLVWNFGISVAARDILELMPHEHHEQVRAMENKLYMPANILFGLLATFAYVCLLLWFPGQGFTAAGHKGKRDE